MLEFKGFTFYISPSSVDYQFYIEFKSFRSSHDSLIPIVLISLHMWQLHCLSPRLDDRDLELEISLKTKLIMTQRWWSRYELTYLSMSRYQQHLHSQRQVWLLGVNVPGKAQPENWCFYKWIKHWAKLVRFSPIFCRKHSTVSEFEFWTQSSQSRQEHSSGCGLASPQPA